MKKITAFEDTRNLLVGKDSTIQNDGIPVFGIDLGTTNSAISVIRKGEKSETIRLKTGKYTMPSCVMYHHGTFTVGDAAYINRDKPNTSYSVKRSMQDTKALIVLTEGREHVELSPAEISAKILRGLVDESDNLYGVIKDVVVTVPAYFNQNGINVTREACELAGLNLIAIANEPTAASLCYDLKPEEGGVKDIVIYDLGGGTFDATLARITEVRDINPDLLDVYNFDHESTGSKKIVSTLAIDGDARLGGDDIDGALLEIVLRKLQGIHINTNNFTDAYREKLLLRLEGLKKDDTTVTYDFAINTIGKDGREIKATIRILPDDFRQAVGEVYLKTRRILNRLIKSVPNAADTIVLVGGSTKSPWLQQMLCKDYPSYTIDNAFDPDLSVSNGAAIQGKVSKFGDGEFQIFDILPMTIGILDGECITPAIKAGASLPSVSTSIFTTTKDEQDSVVVKIYQGNAQYVEECVELGVLTINGIKPQPAGEPNLSITISISADRLMKCIASIDGIQKEIKLNLAGEVDKKSELSRDEKNFIRWKNLANTFDDENRRILLDMLAKYPRGVSKEEIRAFVQEIRTSVQVEV